MPTGAEKSRAEVRSELAQAQAEADGALDDASERLTYNFEEVDSTKSRADVRGEVLQAKRSGSMALPGTARTPFGTTSASFPRNTTVQTAGR